MNPRRPWVALLATVALIAAVAMAQRRFDISQVDRSGIPSWENDPETPRDVFTFVRIRYRDGYGYRSRYGRGYGYGGGKWTIDWPDAELNLSCRLQQMTSLKVNPDPVILELTDPELVNYPFIYIVEPGLMELSDEEVAALRRYLLNGGFLMVDDFWGEAEYANFYEQIKRVFPEREPVELEMDHPIFHTVFDLKLTKNEMQIPNFHTGEYSQHTGITWETPDSRDVHFKGLFDDKGRMMAIICHNTDNGDGWEREGEYPYYFREFSEKKAYPLAINIIFYAMTH
jgi:hypothetical protein